MAGDNIVYDFNGIDSLSAQIAAFVNDMNQTLGEVDRQFQGLLAAGWSGAAADAFQGCSANWHRNAEKMAETLNRLGTTVGNAAVNMRQADQQAAARF
jgi:WXG100 family type VII secretion target